MLTASKFCFAALLAAFLCQTQARHDGDGISPDAAGIAKLLILAHSNKRRQSLLRANVAGEDPNKQTRNEPSRGVSQQVRLGTILRVGKTRKPRKTKGDG